MGSAKTPRELTQEFFAEHVAAHPEEGSTLGVRAQAERLSDPSRAASEEELTRLRTTLREVDALTAGKGREQLSLDARLDLDAIARVAKHHARWIENDGDGSCLELASLANSALQHGALHTTSAEDVRALAERAAAVPRVLAAHAENLRRGARDGRGPDREVVTAFVERVLPGAAMATSALAGNVSARLGARRTDAGEAHAIARLAAAAIDAGDAYRTFARFVGDEIAPRARSDVKLGEAEVAFRLREVMGLESSIDALIALAMNALERAHASLVEHVRRAGHANVKTAEDAREALLSVLGPKPATIADAVALYEHQLGAATRFVEERALVPVPVLLALALEPLPAGIADGGSLVNWPAPLLDRGGRGHALYATDPAAHPIVQMKNLAVHEGIPGHYLQSATWQQGTPSPVRFLGVTDDAAMARSYFGAMLSVEGWAVHMEQLLLAEGFYEPGPERIFFAFCDAIRAMRVLLDLELHARGLAEAEAVGLVMRATLMPEGWARAQIVRAKRIPLQSLTYLVGSTEIAKLRAAAPTLSPLAFHRALLAFGPVPPSRLTGAVGRSGVAEVPGRAVKGADF